MLVIVCQENGSARWIPPLKTQARRHTSTPHDPPRRSPLSIPQNAPDYLAAFSSLAALMTFSATRKPSSPAGMPQ